jgi:hypothetical protein
MLDIKKTMKPRDEFLKASKARFLSVFDAAHPHARLAHMSGFTIFTRALVACGALVALLGGVSVYADTANVNASSALYPFKRASESIKLAFTAPQEKAQLQATFATRRADEIHDLAATQPSSTLLAKLSTDLDTDVNDSIVAAHDTKLGDGNLDAVCGKILSAIATSSQAMDGTLFIKPKALLRFESVCTKDIATNVTNESDQNEATSAAGAASPTFRTLMGAALIKPDTKPTSTESTSTKPKTKELRVRGGGVLNVVFGKDESSHKKSTEHASSTFEPAAAVQSQTAATMMASETLDVTTATASTTVYFPDISGYLKHRDASNLFDTKNDDN